MSDSPSPYPSLNTASNIPKEFDVLVVGAGAAGLYAALCLPSSYRVGLISKEDLPLSASDWAQGGIAAAVDPQDSPILHIEDTLKAGAGLCDRPAVEFLVKNAPDCIQSLVHLGVSFDRKGDRLALTLEAAHSRPRVLHAADTTGRAVVATLCEQVLQRPNIQVISPAFALSLWQQDGRIVGISVFWQNHLVWIRAKAVVLATGGGGQVFAQTTNPELSTGDGVAMAWRAGALLRDLEFFQFHPTALTLPGAPRFLISEAVRGEGAHLVDENGSRFAFQYHPAGELAPRDVVSRAIFSHLAATHPQDSSQAHVFLDLRSIPPETIRHRFPNIIQVCQHWGIDLFQEPIPVTPAAHYWMGGIVTDCQNQTNLPGLYALGETASTGVHGANRLASNSLLECIVFGAQMAHLSLEPLPDWHLAESLPPQVYQDSPPAWQEQALELIRLRSAIGDLMWRSAGICREQKVLEAAIAQISQEQTSFAQLPISQYLLGLNAPQTVAFAGENVSHFLRQWAEVSNLLDIAGLILKSAAFRTESRGGHYRLDYPQLNSHWQVHTLIERDHWHQSPVASDP